MRAAGGGANPLSPFGVKMKTLDLNFYQRYFMLMPFIRLASFKQELMDMELMYQLTDFYGQIRVGETNLQKVGLKEIEQDGKKGFIWDDPAAEELKISVVIEDELSGYLLNKVFYLDEKDDMGKVKPRDWGCKYDVVSLYAQLMGRRPIGPIDIPRAINSKPEPVSIKPAKQKLTAIKGRKK